MAKPDAVFIHIGTYPDEAAARADYDVVKDLHAAGAVGTYDAAVVGAAVGGVGGHPWRGMSRSDVKEFGEFIEWLTPPVADRRPEKGEAAWWARNPTSPIWGRSTISSS